nr:hypothetical transcript [Hymenolepis microstoma]
MAEQRNLKGTQADSKLCGVPRNPGRLSTLGVLAMEITGHMPGLICVAIPFKKSRNCNGVDKTHCSEVK